MSAPAWTKSRVLKIVGCRAPSASAMMRVRLVVTSALAERASRGLNLAHLQHALGKTNINHDCQPADDRDVKCVRLSLD
jgi:hypothetical protein